MFLSVPTWIFRYPHPALSAHWVLLWAFYLYLRTPPGGRSSRRLGGAKLGQLAVAALVTPYLAAMSLLVYAASLLRSRDRKTIAVGFATGLAVVLVANWFAGYFAAETMKAQWGFDWESANVLGWLIPQHSGIIGDAQWIANVNATPWQYEGYAYLGLGVLGLLALFVPHLESFKGVLRRHVWLFALVVGTALFALSNHIFFGTHEVLTYPIPRFLRWIPNQFRSPGRFVWIPTYALILFLLHWAFTRFTTWRRFAIIGVLVVVQVLDASGDWRVQSRKTSAAHDAILDVEAWRPVVHAHSAVAILPPYSCVDGDDASTLDRASLAIQSLASERGTPINGTYSARAIRNCAIEERAWATMQLGPEVLYVLLPQALAVADRFEAHGATCAVFDYGRVCSTNRAAIAQGVASNLLRATAGPIALPYGQQLALADAPTVNAGWTAPEAAGRWTTTSLASIQLVLRGEPPARSTLKLQAQARLCGSRDALDVDVLIDETQIATLHFDRAGNDPQAVRSVPIANRDALRGRTITLQLRPHDVRPLAKLGCGEDARKLGVAVSRIWFE